LFLIFTDSNETIQQLLFTDDRPTPMSIYNWLSSHDSIAMATNLPRTYMPYGIEDPSLVCFHF